jgi:hypothetical protein
MSLYDDLVSMMREIEGTSKTLPVKGYANSHTIRYLEHLLGYSTFTPPSTLHGMTLYEHESVPTGRIVLLNHKDETVGIIVLEEGT